MGVESGCPCLTPGYEAVALGSVMGWVVSPISHILRTQPQSLQMSPTWRWSLQRSRLTEVISVGSDPIVMVSLQGEGIWTGMHAESGEGNGSCSMQREGHVKTQGEGNHYKQGERV